MIADIDLYSCIGLLGTACIVGAYFYLTVSEAPNAVIVHTTNLAGAAFLTISLMVHPNLASLVLEGFWAAIAIWGLVKAVRKKPRSAVASEKK